MKLNTVPVKAEYGVIEHYHYHPVVRGKQRKKLIASIALTVCHSGSRWELHMPGMIDDVWVQPSRKEAEKQMRTLLRERSERRNQREVE